MGLASDRIVGGVAAHGVNLSHADPNAQEHRLPVKLRLDQDERGLGGAGLGLAHVVILFLCLPGIKEAGFIPRGPGRLVP